MLNSQNDKMPYRKSKSKTTLTRTKPKRRPTASRSSAFRKQRRQVVRGPFRNAVQSDPFPNIKFARLAYQGDYLLTTGTGGALGNTQSFNLNSLHQPDNSGGAVAHQPYGHDDLALLYARYKVHGVLIEIHATDPNSDGLGFAARIIPPEVSAALTGDFLSYAGESPFTTVRGINNSGSQKVSMKQYMPMATACGITPLQFKAAINDHYSAVFGTSPTKMPTLAIAAGSFRGDAGLSLVVRVKLTFFAQFSERRRLPKS